MGQSATQAIIAGAIFIAVYAFIIIDKIDRTLVALIGAVLMIITGILSQENAFKEVDYNTLGLLISMMIIVMITRRSGVFEYLAIKTIKIAKCEPWKILVLLSIITGILSGILDNVTTILLVLPLTMNMARDLHINPAPFIIAEAFASNVGGTATLIGDPPNIMIGSFAGLDFMDFIKNEYVIFLIILFITTYLFVLIYKRKLHTTDEAKSKVMSMNEYDAVSDHKLLKKSIIIIT
ncbi:MAG: sodium:proton antiporter, partial [Bacillota bacterium]|nr:sodium:proton antiporter [Bacillota bacterium]